MFDFEIVEVNDRPRDMPPVEFSNTGKTAGLLLCLTKSVHHSACNVVLDSGFCVLLELVELQKVAVFAGGSIKKHCFWSAWAPGNAIDHHFDDKEVGSVHAIGSSLDGVKYHVWTMKDAGYGSKIMGTASVCFIMMIPYMLIMLMAVGYSSSIQSHTHSIMNTGI